MPNRTYVGLEAQSTKSPGQGMVRMSDVTCVAPTSCLLGLGPVWSPTEGFLWWCDQRKAKLHRYNPRTGNTRRYDLPLRASALALADGYLLMAGDQQIGLYDTETEDYQPLTTLTDLPVGARINDGRTAPDGSFWFGTCDDRENRSMGRYYRLAKPVRIEPTRLDPVPLTYGFGFSPDAMTFYTSDTTAQEILAFDHDPDTGVLTERRVFASTMDQGCYPDGLAIDLEGGVWSAQWAGSRIVRYDRDGRVDRTIKLPVSRPTHCAFGGDDLRTLYITTARAGLSPAALDRQPMAGCLFALQTDVSGLPILPYAR